MQRLSQNMHDPVFVQNPYSFYDVARQKGDLLFWEEQGMPAAFSHRAVRHILTHKSMKQAIPRAKQTVCPAHIAQWQENEKHSMLSLDPPAHTRLRRLVLTAFTSRHINAQKDMISTLCNELIDSFPAGPFDFLKAYAQPLPVIVIARLLGVPESEKKTLLAWSNAMVAMYQAGRSKQTELAANKATIEFTAFLSEYIKYRRAHPKDDLITKLIAAEEEDGNRLSAKELISTCILLLNAGHEATVHSFGNGLKALLEQNVRQITPETIEEILRFDPPLHIFTRWAHEDIECFDHKIAKDTQVACVLGAANRDPMAFEQPNAFLPNREIKPHMSFGAGIHFCVGAPLARLELEIGLKTLLARCPNITFCGDTEYSDTYHFHGLKQLMIQSNLPF